MCTRPEGQTGGKRVTIGYIGASGHWRSIGALESGLERYRSAAWGKNYERFQLRLKVPIPFPSWYYFFLASVLLFLALNEVSAGLLLSSLLFLLFLGID